ncbi:MAG: HEAT repeat domain-containing protein, partial [Planctomycetia bacterium]|nr:HEAT repeat domain-containing protein [Planctomycetia bacterium]
FNGNKLNEILVGRTELELKTWHHVVLTRNDNRVDVFLNGNPQPEISGDAARGYADGVDEVFLGGRNDNLFNLEGKMDEVAIYDRVLTATEVTAHFEASGRTVPVSVNAEATSALQPEPRPRSPAESLAIHHVREGFVVELVAAEPLVLDPVAIAWSADGKLWVVEMADYPNGMDGNGKPGGRVRYLQDTNDDGKYDKSTLFLDGINFPTSVLPWHQGVLVTAAPEIFYAEDSDGDGKADVRRTLYSGFFEGNQQLRVNGLRWGLDNWIYCALGSHHGGYAADTKIRSADSETVTQVGGRDFRIRPDAGLLDPLAGPSQFGRNRDDWGNWFGVQNSFPLWHYVLEDYYTRRNPHVAPPDPRKQLLLPANPKVYPVTSEKRFHSFEQSGHFTSACSAMIYRDELLFGGGETQHSFTCEPFHNLVHHAVLRDDGVSFHAERAQEEQQSELFASEDRWCRPVMARTGPDGALWVVDMYRYMIEHPQWLPKEGQDELRPFFRSGDDRGRIYRIYPRGTTPRQTPQLSTIIEQLVMQLESPNGWQRDVAQQLLVERQEANAVLPLTKLADASDMPVARLHALCTLDGLKALTSDVLERALRDPHAGVRRHAVRLAEPIAAQHPELIGFVLPLARDPNAKVRLQVACSLGQWQDPRIGETLVRLALNDSQDAYIIAAVMSSLNKSNIAEALSPPRFKR